jgi:hypothetical protein
MEKLLDIRKTQKGRWEAAPHQNRLSLGERACGGDFQQEN